MEQEESLTKQLTDMVYFPGLPLFQVCPAQEFVCYDYSFFLKPINNCLSWPTRLRLSLNLFP
jgi:hypothetical protein